MKHKIIFLDIDGVLTYTDRFYNSIKSGQIPKDRDELHFPYFDETSRKLLNDVIQVTGAKIVISSTYRKSGIDYCKELWKRRNMLGEIIGVTPVFQVTDGDKK